jgi:hypothetical protein
VLRRLDDPATELVTVVTLITRNTLDIADVVVDFSVLGA